ncbi:glycoside hydrolase family 71 protein [Fomitopsis serialis]|uniref:glycoside hydrolase family 71 protein n=1 Tax=Fomitopsis serialis TaxID=139415 RepID=UPI00200844FC|nr:glycoside hydrolase family 71 protein [Neoantrodia serialis]KAH9927687.1 glycoside hydrolase family 71 protein [Neoantrodia serialis]
MRSRIHCFWLFVAGAIAVANAHPHGSTDKTERAASDSKLVVAHHIVGYTYPYDITDWESDIQLAYNSGLDGFALNVGSNSWESTQVANAYQAAANLGLDFKLFLSLDMTSFPCTTANDASALCANVSAHASHPNQLLWNGNVFVSTFSGSDCTFGQNSAAAGWQSEFIDQLTGSNAVHFVPSFFVDPSTFTTFNDIMDGDFNWNGGWPTDLTYSSAQSELGSNAGDLDDATFPSSAESVLSGNVGAFTSDSQYINGLNSVSGSDKTYIAAVTPWFFVHYSPQTYDKNWIYLADYWSYVVRWETLIANRDQVDVVEVVTWNDYSESHYIGPIEGSQPNSQAWTNGMPHLGWLAMTNYYATAFRNGSYQSITEDQIYMWARPHPKNANASDDSVGKPTSYQLTEDKLWAVVFATSNATVAITTASGTTQTSNVSAGVTKLSMDLVPGSGMSATLTRNGQTVVSLDPGTNFTFNANPETYNYNAFVCYATSG